MSVAGSIPSSASGPYDDSSGIPDWVTIGNSGGGWGDWSSGLSFLTSGSIIRNVEAKQSISEHRTGSRRTVFGGDRRALARATSRCEPEPDSVGQLLERTHSTGALRIGSLASPDQAGARSPTSWSVSTPGGLNASVEMVAVLLGGKGYGPILFETVGVGQSELEAIERTDPAVVVVAPGFGAGDRVLRVNSLGSAARRLGCCGGGFFRIRSGFASQGRRGCRMWRISRYSHGPTLGASHVAYDTSSHLVVPHS